MKYLATIILSSALVGPVLSAHGGNEHVRGVVTNISANAVTVQTADKAAKTLTLTDKTTFKQGTKAVHLADLKVGDRVVIDVPEETTTALLVQIAAPKRVEKSSSSGTTTTSK